LILKRRISAEKKKEETRYIQIRQVSANKKTQGWLCDFRGKGGGGAATKCALKKDRVEYLEVQERDQKSLEGWTFWYLGGGSLWKAVESNAPGKW